MQASLAALFAARCTPDRCPVHATSRVCWIYLQQFAEFVERQRRPPRDLDELTPGMVRLWRASLGKAGGANAFSMVSPLLRDDARLQEGQVADELARRYRAPKSAVQSYSEAEFDRITVAARRQFRTALQRIRDNAIHLQRWREGVIAEGSADWVVGEGLDILARTGDLPKYTEKSGRRIVVTGKYRKAFGGMSAGATWQRLFLSRLDAVALGVLLVAEFGWNLSVIDRAEVPLASPDQGDDGHPTYRIPLEKPRRGAGHHYETRNVTDSGADSPGRLITQALEATRFAPRHRRRTRTRHQPPDRVAILTDRTAAGGRPRRHRQRGDSRRPARGHRPPAVPPHPGLAHRAPPRRGNPERSNGALTIVALAIEAGVPQRPHPAAHRPEERVLPPDQGSRRA